MTDKPVTHNRTDVVLLNKELKDGIITDFSVPQDEDLEKVYSEKIKKYEDLASDNKEIYKFSTLTIQSNNN